ncbi:MAG TPA: hypothetical protein PK264_09585, partial [Hyphomicrobiaceae bacterium]|nr:hypothetical protein [Hyphomicrobiaceae bacterium]
PRLAAVIAALEKLHTQVAGSDGEWDAGLFNSLVDKAATEFNDDLSGFEVEVSPIDAEAFANHIEVALEYVATLATHGAGTPADTKPATTAVLDEQAFDAEFEEANEAEQAKGDGGPIRKRMQRLIGRNS